MPTATIREKRKKEMRTLKHKMVISAPPEKVFDLISNVENFSKYSAYIKEVRPVGDKKFLWRVELFGLKLEWEATVVESNRPEYFAWKSTSGIYNTGSYMLTPTGHNSTTICFTMEYDLKNSATERLIATLVEPVLERLLKESLDKVRLKLER